MAARAGAKLCENVSDEFDRVVGEDDGYGERTHTPRPNWVGVISSEQGSQPPRQTKPVPAGAADGRSVAAVFAAANLDRSGTAPVAVCDVRHRELRAHRAPEMLRLAPPRAAPAALPACASASPAGSRARCGCVSAMTASANVQPSLSQRARDGVERLAGLVLIALGITVLAVKLLAWRHEPSTVQQAAGSDGLREQT